MQQVSQRIGALWAVVLLALLSVAPAQVRAAERDAVEAFLKVTGFDVALESITLSAGDAPLMLGVQPDAFGADWKRVSGEVFDVALMQDMAIGILSDAMSDEMLAHAAGFYASDLGARLVAVENASHMEKNKDSAAQDLLAELRAARSPRLALIERMNIAIDAGTTGARAIQEIQIRFLMAATTAGVVELKMDEADMRALFKEGEGELVAALKEGALANSALTYKSFSDADVEAYAAALEHETMQQVYELMNGIQYEIMANRFEVLAGRMAELHPGQDI